MAEINPGLDPLGSRSIAVADTDLQGRNSAVSWAAIFAGAAGAAVLSLVLLILGTGLGLSAVSPWTLEGISAATFGFATIGWLTFTQLAASGIGGYLAGRLRSRWTAVSADEVLFRDIAHGFLSWAVAALLSVAVLTSVVGAVVSGGVRAGATVAGGAASAVGSVAAGAADTAQLTGSVEYFVDSLFRRPFDAAGEGGTPATPPSTSSPDGQVGQQDQARVQADTQQYQPGASAQRPRALAGETSQIPTTEVVRIFARALNTGALPEKDQRYIAQLIAQRTGIGQKEAEQRVLAGFEEVKTTFDTIETTTREAVDEAREASAYAALWLFVALLIGAFFASVMAVYGGRQRDA